MAVVAALAVLAFPRGGHQGLVSSPALSVGDGAPDFALQATDGRMISLSDFTGKRNALLYFSMGYG